MDAVFCKTVGVSNYQITRLQKVLDVANIPPAVNQVRCSPFIYSVALHAFCLEHGIALEGYGPLTQGSELGNQTLRMLAEKYQRSTARILPRWALQKDIIIIPKIQSKERLHENAELYDFNIADEDMHILNTFSRD